MLTICNLLHVEHITGPGAIVGPNDKEEDVDTDDLMSDLQRQVDLMDLAIKKKRLQSLSDEPLRNTDKYTTIGASLLNLSTLNFNGLFHSLFWIKLKRSVGLKGLTVT